MVRSRKRIVVSAKLKIKILPKIYYITQLKILLGYRESWRSPISMAYSDSLTRLFPFILDGIH